MIEVEQVKFLKCLVLDPDLGLLYRIRFLPFFIEFLSRSRSTPEVGTRKHHSSTLYAGLSGCGSLHMIFSYSLNRTSGITSLQHICIL